MMLQGRVGVAREQFAVVTKKVERAFKPTAINADADAIAIEQFPDWAASKCLWTDVADASTRGNAGKTPVRDERNILSERQVAQSGRDLIGFGHTAADGTEPNENDDVTWPNGVGSFAFDRLDRRLL